MRFAIPLVALVSCMLAPAVHAQQGKLVIPALDSRESLEVMLLRTSASSRCEEACVVRNAPYSAERVMDSARALPDGNRVLGHARELLYRDGDGRTRVESEWGAAPLVQIQDPVANMSYRLYPAQKIGLSMTISRPAPSPVTAPTIQAPAGNGAAKAVQQLAPAAANIAGSADSQTTKRSLGTRQMEGLTVEGTLETSTIPAGKAGNVLPIVSTTETWYAPDLKLAVYVKSVDPRYGERVTRLQNIGRTEPTPMLFKAPADYTVQQIARH